MGSMLGELPPLGFEVEMVGDKGPVEWRHPVGNVVVFMDPGLIVAAGDGSTDPEESYSSNTLSMVQIVPALTAHLFLRGIDDESDFNSGLDTSDPRGKHSESIRSQMAPRTMIYDFDLVHEEAL